MSEFDVAVIGAGITGLSAAHRAATLGGRVVVLERSPHLGGMVVTDNDDGFVVERGPDSFVAGKGAILDLASELGLAEGVISSRSEHRGSYVWWEGRLHPLPKGLLLMAPSRLWPVLSSSLLSWRGKLRILADLFIPRAEADDESLESFVVRRLGHEMLDRIAEPLVAGIHAAEPSTMSLGASFPRFREMERRNRSLILAARSMAANPVSSGGVSYFASFAGGMSVLIDALGAGMETAEIRLKQRVVELDRRSPNGYRLTVEGGDHVGATSVILAVPAATAAALLVDVSPEAANVVAEIRQVPTATVTLAYRAEQLPPLHGYGFVVPSAQRRPLLGVSYLSRKWDGRVPDSSYELLRAFVGGIHGRELTGRGHRVLRSVAREELAALIGITAEAVRTWTNVWPEGLHQYTMGHLERIARAEGALAHSPGLYLAGAGFHGIGLNECVVSGRRAAEAALAKHASSPVAGRERR